MGVNKRVDKRFNKNQSGYYLSKKIPVVFWKDKIYQVEEYLKKELYKFEESDYIYVVDKEKKFLGFFPITYLPKCSKDKTAFEISRKFEKIFVNEKDKKERAVYLSLKYNISSVPVLDSEDKLIGAVKDIDILKMLHQKHAEERFILSGVDKSNAEVDSILSISIFKSIRHRAIWLILGLLGGLFAAEIIGFFESTLKEHILIAAFIPLVVYIASAVGTQLSAFAIRDFALFKKIEFSKYFFKQLLSVFIIAIILGIISGGISFWMYKIQEVSIIIGISILITTLSSILTGLLIPFIFRKFKSDPANGSGPIGTIIQDLLSIVIYFTIVGILL